MILVIRNSRDGAVREIDLGPDPGEWIVGRQNDCQIVLDSRAVSRKHARVFGGPETWFAADLGSTGGTRLNGQSVTDPVPFNPGDTLEIGGFILKLAETAAAAPETPTAQAAAPEAGAPEPKTAEAKAAPEKDEFKEANLLYTPELMNLKQKIHEYVLTKLNLTEQSMQKLADRKSVV